jgi:hypothetical protein
LLFVGALAAPSERTWADVDAWRQRRRATLHRAPPPSEDSSLGTIRVGTRVAGGEVVSFRVLGPNAWRVVVRAPNGDAIVRIARDDTPADRRVPPYGLTAEHSTLPREHVLSVVHALADVLRREQSMRP